MNYYPVYLDLQNKKCVIIGGGAVGSRKAKGLVECNADVYVVAPVIEESLLALGQKGLVRIHEKAYQARDLEGAFLAFAATGDPQLNQRVFSDAAGKNILCNIADSPKDCHFIVPSVIRRQELTITVSTSGKSPALSKQLRIELEKSYGPEYGEFLKLMGLIREKLLEKEPDIRKRKDIFNRLAQSPLPKLIRENRKMEIENWLTFFLGEILDKEELERIKTR